MKQTIGNLIQFDLDKS